MKKIIIFLFAIHNLSLFAQDVSVNAQYPSTVNAGQQFSITWRVDTNEEGNFMPPSLSPFNVLAGPMTSYSSSTQIINGRRTQSISYSYIYYMQASQEGNFVIPPAVFTLNNKTYSSDSLRIEVVGGGATQRNSAANNQAESDKDVFVSITLNKREAYVGEPVTATVKLFTKINIAGINSIKYPQFDGFVKIDLDRFQRTDYTQENVGGTIYRTLIMNQFLLYPQRTGEIVIEPVQLTYYVRQQGFGLSFLNTVIESQSVRIKINPLPRNQPADYSGIVGKLSINSSINKDTVNVNDAINLNITISGSNTGNLRLATAPTLQLSPDIEVYNPRTTDNIGNSANGTTGSKSFEYLLIPRQHGDFTIPPVTYSYFDASSGRYEQLKTPEHNFYVRGSGSGSETTVLGGVSRVDVTVGRDVRFIKTDVGRFTKIKTNLISNRTYESLYILTALIFFIVLFIRREHVKRNADISKVRNRKAGKIAVKRLKNADMCLKNNEFDKFYEEVIKALWGYFSDKLNIPKADLTRTRVALVLSGKKIDEAAIEKLNEILDRCEYVRFAPSSSETEAAALYEGASQIIKTVENTIT